MSKAETEVRCGIWKDQELRWRHWPEEKSSCSMMASLRFSGLKRIEVHVSLDEGGDFYFLIQDTCQLMGVEVKRVARDLEKNGRNFRTFLWEMRKGAEISPVKILLESTEGSTENLSVVM
jgi:hypothetical protein